MLVMLHHSFCVGVILRSTLDDETAASYGSIVHDLISRTRHGVRDLDPGNDLSFLRIRTKKHEIMVAPGEHERLNSCCAL